MTERYKVSERTLIAGRFFDAGSFVTEGRLGVTKEDIDAAVGAKTVEKVKADEADDVEMTDAAPSLTEAHHTKRVVPAEKAADKKAAQEG